MSGFGYINGARVNDLAINGDDSVVHGTAVITEVRDTAAAAGGLRIGAVENTIEARDTATAAGALAIKGASSPTENPDTATSAAMLLLKGNASFGEAADTCAASGKLPPQALQSRIRLITVDAERRVVPVQAEYRCVLIHWQPRRIFIGADRREAA
ncbi:hypothetical protein BRDID11004_47740 [Bradyrhizobium diazoefficiens]|uniref:Uncharacterized protein n=1 Tax=Bradyrhizobium diazoefficiens TaxID=1355477 RepID=A0A810A4S2_9BRAD|nr:hypothetical protein [Bradyrhizobium diazoefficiens]BBZ94323.1 hypothetical protein F07S3_41560 [Bradyrhizobium diazoefficiens]BCE56411.1 hypothetical protein XF5B_39230 [Bradyrhizobium diazoefficiens]